MSYIDVDAYENAWMGLTKEDLKDVKRPLSNLTDEEKNDFHLHIIKKMRDPEYFHWTVKTFGSRLTSRTNLCTKRVMEKTISDVYCISWFCSRFYSFTAYLNAL